MRNMLKMRSIRFLLSLGIVFFCMVGVPHNALGLSDKSSVREPAVAGSFYPHNAAALRTMIDRYLDAVPEQEIAGDLKVIIAPHAGYIYSGPVAAYGYKLLEGKTYDTVVVLALSHFYPFRGASVFDGTHYETPLGMIPIDREAVAHITQNSSLIDYHPRAHLREHSLEVHLPFLQTVLGDAFSLVPIVLGDTRYETAHAVAEQLAALAKTKNILVIASTDLSHYNPYAIAQKQDSRTIQEIRSLDPQQLQMFFDSNHDAACGKCPLVTALLYARTIEASDITLLNYANSGDTAGDKNKVVGYVSLAITKEGNDVMKENQKTMSHASKNELFTIVRDTIREHLTTGKITPVTSDNPELQSQSGAFVTLHTKSGALRGCIGSFVSDKPLYQTIQEMALSSAFRDHRFPPVQLDELDDLTIEISVLSPMEKIDDVSVIELGKHGIYIKAGFRSGTFLPQVATETGWSLEEFLGHCARDKAGLGWDGWKEANVYIYTADVFGEEKH